jgi:hypothetical protein
MAHFHRYPDGQAISRTNFAVDGTSVVIGLWGYLDFDKQELWVTNDGDDLFIEQLQIEGNSRFYKIRVRHDTQAIKEMVTARIYGNTVNWETWDWFQITFRFPKQKAAELVVRAVTADLFGGPVEPWRATQVPSIDIVDPARYTRGSQKDPLSFRFAAGKPVVFAVFAAKLGSTERAFVLIVPTHRKADKLLIVITHTFGQNDAYYSGKGYSNPLSLPLIRDVTDRFGLERWGAQLFAARNDTALLLPVRAKAGGGGELGPFITNTGVGAMIILRIMELSQDAFGLKRVDLVTFSSGIYDANQFVAAGSKGIPIHAGCAQDPAGGAALSSVVPLRRQFLSGYTTHFQAKPGFEYLPKPFWINEPKYKKLFSNDDFNYMHTWCIPQYTLFLALST